MGIIAYWKKQIRRRPLGLAALLLFVVALLRLCFVSWPETDPGHVLYGRVVALDPLTVKTSEAKVNVYGEVPDVKIGNSIRCSGVYRPYESAGNPGGFDQKRYYGIRGISGYFFAVNFEVTDASYDRARMLLENCKRLFEKRIDHSFDEPERGMIRAMLLGEQKEMDPGTKELFRNSGISHILAISGLHISFFGWGLYRVLRRLLYDRKLCASISSVFLSAYVLMIGAGASSVRALLLFLIAMCAEILGRGVDLPSSLFLSFALMVTMEPKYLLDSGFQFSFLAVGSLGVLSRVVVKKESDEERETAEYVIRNGNIVHTGRKRWKYKLKEIYAGSFMMQMVLLPLILNSYYSYPVYSFLLNLIILPFMSVVLTSATLAIPFGTVAGMPAFVILRGYTLLCEITQKLPFGNMTAGIPGTPRMIIYYGLLAVAVFLAYKRRYIIHGCILAAAVALMLMRRLPCDRMVFLDVGQGDCIYIETSQGLHVLVDAGSSDKDDVAKYCIIPFLKSQGVTDLDAIFLTHLDQDHINGVAGLVDSDEIEVGELITTQSASLTPSDVLGLTKDECPTAVMHRGMQISDGNMKLVCLYPYDDIPDGNNGSLVLRMTMGDFSVLLTGDLEEEGEYNLMNEGADSARHTLADGGNANISPTLKAEILKVGHHGSSHSTSEQFLEKVDPGVAVISYGRYNSYGHPHKETLERLEDRGVVIYRTAEDGAVSILFTKRGARIQTFRSHDK